MPVRDVQAHPTMDLFRLRKVEQKRGSPRPPRSFPSKVLDHRLGTRQERFASPRQLQVKSTEAIRGLDGSPGSRAKPDARTPASYNHAFVMFAHMSALAWLNSPAFVSIRLRKQSNLTHHDTKNA